MRTNSVVAFVVVSALSGSSAFAAESIGAQTINRTQKAAKFALTSLKRTLKVGAYGAAATGAAYGATLLVGGAVSFWSSDGGAAFHTALNTANNVLANAKDVASASAQFAPYAGAAALAGAAGYIGKPGAVYTVKKAGQLWQSGGIKADVAFGALNAGAAFALGGDPVSAGYISQTASIGARAAVTGLEKVVSGTVTKTRW
jgi:hypothetical protein